MATDRSTALLGATANVLNKVPKSMQPKTFKDALRDIGMADSREAVRAYDGGIKRCEAKSGGWHVSGRMGTLLVCYDFPAEHWQHIRTTNPMESVFATVQLRTAKTKNCGSRKTTLIA